MDGLAPPLKCTIELQSAIRNGESIRSGVLRYVQSARASDDFAASLRGVLLSLERGREWRSLVNGQSSQRRALVEIIASGLSGQAISSQLESIRGEIERACEDEIKAHLEILPLKMLIPLLLLQFPAFLLLMFGPLLKHLIAEVNR